MLVMMAPMAARNAREFDYIGHLRQNSGASDLVSVNRIEGTDHAFVKGEGKWLSFHSPLETGEERGTPSDHNPLNVQVA